MEFRSWFRIVYHLIKAPEKRWWMLPSNDMICDRRVTGDYYICYICYMCAYCVLNYLFLHLDFSLDYSSCYLHLSDCSLIAVVRVCVRWLWILLKCFLIGLWQINVVCVCVVVVRVCVCASNCALACRAQFSDAVKWLAREFDSAKSL